MSDAGKICIKCGVDCAGKARVKDSRGRYLCGVCYAEAKKKQGSMAGGTAMASATGIATDAIVDQPDEVRSIEARPTAAAPYEMVPGDLPQGPNPDGMPCPECGQHIPAKSVLCVTCGYNAAIGAKIDTVTGADKPKKHHRDAEHEALSREVARQAYMTPAIATIVAVGINIGLIAGIHGESLVAPYMILFAINVVIGVILFLACSMTWIGMDAPLPLMTLQVAAAYAVIDAISTVAGLAPILPLLAVIGLMLTYAMILAHYLDIDFVDAIIVAILSGIARIAVYFTVAQHVLPQ